MTTTETIAEIEKLFIENGEKLAVLRPIEKYEDVDWSIIAKHFQTDNINSYTHPDKIVIEA